MISAWLFDQVYADHGIVIDNHIVSFISSQLEEKPCFYNLGFIVIALAISSIGYNTILLTITTANMSEHDQIANEVQ